MNNIAVLQHHILVIAWTQISRRSEELSKKIGAEYINLGRVDKPFLKRIFFVIYNFYKSYRLLCLKKPDVVITFHAHPFISLVGIVYKLIHGCIIIPDLHSAAYLDNYKLPLKTISTWVWKKADILIIHNKMSVNYFQNICPVAADKLFVLEDPIPSPPNNHHKGNSKKGGIVKGVLISRFASDEPVIECVKKIERINNLQVYITGNYLKEKINPADFDQEKIIFTGFIDDNEYWTLLRSVQFVIVLTTREYTLLSAGYEALSLCKPLLIPNKNTLIDYYQDAVEYFSMDSLDIIKPISNVIERLDYYENKMTELKVVREKKWNNKINSLLAKISDAIKMQHLRMDIVF